MANQLCDCCAGNTFTERVFIEVGTGRRFRAGLFCADCGEMCSPELPPLPDVSQLDEARGQRALQRAQRRRDLVQARHDADVALVIKGTPPHPA